MTRLVHRVLLIKLSLQQATETGDVEVWIAQIVTVFQTVGRNMANARRPYVMSCICGTMSRRCG